MQKGFLTLAKKKPNKYKIINSNLDMKINKDIILKKISELIK